MDSVSRADLSTRRRTPEQRLSLETNEPSPGAHWQAAVTQNLLSLLIELGDLGIEIAFGLSYGSLLFHRPSYLNLRRTQDIPKTASRRSAGVTVSSRSTKISTPYAVSISFSAGSPCIRIVT